MKQKNKTLQRAAQAAANARKLAVVAAPEPIANLTGLCGDCRHWAARAGQRGTCKRYPPTVLIGTQSQPHTDDTDYCGEQSPRATGL